MSMRELLELVFHEAAAWGPGGDEALRRYDDNGKGGIRWAVAHGGWGVWVHAGGGGGWGGV